jgi:hypothetical protein
MPEMRVTSELSDVLKQACKEVAAWEDWQRSIDPQGSQGEAKCTQEVSSNGTHSQDREDAKINLR